MARATGITEIIVPIGGSPVRLVTPKQWRRAVRQGEIERSTKITREHRLTASSEEIAVSTMQAEECLELQPLLDEFLGPVASVEEPDILPSAPAPAPSPPSPPAPPATISVSSQKSSAARKLAQKRDEVKAGLSAIEARMAKTGMSGAIEASDPSTNPAPHGSSAERPANNPSLEPPASLPATPSAAPSARASSTENAALRWLAMFPGAIIGSLLVWAFLAWAAGYLSFDLSLLEAVGAYMLGFLGASLYTQIGMSIAPAKTRLAKWILILPYLPFWAFGALLFVLTLYFGVTDDSPGGIVVRELLSFDQLSSWWQLLWLTLGYVMGGFSVINEPASAYE
ncbi:MAG: hypothetical protein AAGH57_02600 [Pseudomonadota bacterium]